MRSILLITATVAVCGAATAAASGLPFFPLDFSRIDGSSEEISHFFPIETRILTDLRFPEEGLPLLGSLAEKTPGDNPAFPEPTLVASRHADEPAAILTMLGGLTLIGAGVWRRRFKVTAPVAA